MLFICRLLHNASRKFRQHFPNHHGEKSNQNVRPRPNTCYIVIELKFAYAQAHRTQNPNISNLFVPKLSTVAVVVGIVVAVVCRLECCCLPREILLAWIRFQAGVLHSAHTSLPWHCETLVCADGAKPKHRMAAVDAV